MGVSATLALVASPNGQLWAHLRLVEVLEDLLGLLGQWRRREVRVVLLLVVLLLVALRSSVHLVLALEYTLFLQKN